MYMCIDIDMYNALIIIIFLKLIFTKIEGKKRQIMCTHSMENHTSIKTAIFKEALIV